MNKVQAPVIGTYEVKNCPNCDCKPIVDVGVSKNERADEVRYELHVEVYCSACNPQAEQYTST